MTMADLENDPVMEATALITQYSFDLAGHTAASLMSYWLSQHPPEWLRLAIIEALYQGRYKAISIEQILNLWQRRGQPVCHFNHEFERIICGSAPRHVFGLQDLASPPASASESALTDADSTGSAKSTASPTPTAPTAKSTSAPLESAFTSNAVELDDRALAQTQDSTSAKHAIAHSSFLSSSAFSPHVFEAKEDVVKHPILQFTPTVEQSNNFHIKLKAVSQVDEHTKPATAPNLTDEMAIAADTTES